MAKIKKVEKRKKNAVPRSDEDRAQTESKSTPPPLSPLNEETPALRAAAEAPPLRAPEEDTSRLYALSEEAVLDTSLSAQSKERAASSMQSSSSNVEEDQRVMSTTVMSADKETATVLTVLGNESQTPAVQYLIGQAMRFLRPDRPAEQKTGDSVKPVHEDKKDESNVEVDYDPDSSDEGEQAALRAETKAGHSALKDPLSSGHLALRIEPTTALVKEPSSRHKKENVEGGDMSAEDTSDSVLSITSDLIMREGPDACSPAANTANPVLYAKDIMNIVERKDISIKTPVHNHNPQRQGLENNLLDFGDALLGYTSDGGTIRINQGLATLMLIAATAKAPNKLLMERRKKAFEQVTAQVQNLLENQREDYERQREAIAKQHQEHLETMRKQNELLQQEVMKTRELYSQAYQQFEITPPAPSMEESRALTVQAALTKNFKNRAERNRADYEI
jgi:hypothetical protein